MRWGGVGGGGVNGYAGCGEGGGALGVGCCCAQGVFGGWVLKHSASFLDGGGGLLHCAKPERAHSSSVYARGVRYVPLLVLHTGLNVCPCPCCLCVHVLCSWLTRRSLRQCVATWPSVPTNCHLRQSQVSGDDGGGGLSRGGGGLEEGGGVQGVQAMCQTAATHVNRK